MTFVALIQDEVNKHAWSKVIKFLAVTSESIKFVVTLNEMSLSAINVAKTSHAEAVFSKEFFYKYSADFSDTISEGFDFTEVNELERENYSGCSFSFIVNSKHLAALFKNPDTGDLEYIGLQVNWSRKLASSLQFKLLVENRTKSTIVKRYQTGIQPVTKDRLEISAKFKNDVDQAQEKGVRWQDKPNVSHLVIHQDTFKDFLNTVPLITEDMKIDIKQNKISFTAFTKEVLKNNESIRNQILVTITLSIDDLYKSYLEKDAEGLNRRSSLSFRIRDFRNFLNLVTSLDRSNASNNSSDALDVDVRGNNSIEIYYRRAGDPIMFEYRANTNLAIQLVQITDYDLNDESESLPGSSHSFLSKEIIKSYSMQKNVVPAIAKPNSQTISSGSKHIGDAEGKRSAKKLFSKSADIFINDDTSGRSLFVANDAETDDGRSINGGQEFAPSPTGSSPYDAVTYERMPTTGNLLGIDLDIDVLGNSTANEIFPKGNTNNPRKNRNVSNRKHPRQENDATDYSSDDQETEIREIRRRKTDPDNVQLGPTQGNIAPKSIFDYNC